MPMEVVFIMVVALVGIAGAALGLAVYGFSSRQDEG